MKVLKILSAGDPQETDKYVIPIAKYKDYYVAKNRKSLIASVFKKTPEGYLAVPQNNEIKIGYFEYLSNIDLLNTLSDFCRLEELIFVLLTEEGQLIPSAPTISIKNTRYLIYTKESLDLYLYRFNDLFVLLKPKKGIYERTSSEAIENFISKTAWCVYERFRRSDSFTELEIMKCLKTQENYIIHKPFEGSRGVYDREGNLLGYIEGTSIFAWEIYGRFLYVDTYGSILVSDTKRTDRNMKFIVCARLTYEDIFRRAYYGSNQPMFYIYTMFVSDGIIVGRNDLLFIPYIKIARETFGDLPKPIQGEVRLFFLVLKRLGANMPRDLAWYLLGFLG